MFNTNFIGVFMKKVLLGIIILGIFAFSNHSFAQSGMQIGVVNVETILKEMPEATEADNQLKAMQQQVTDTLMKMQTEFMAKVQEYQKQKSLIPPEKQVEEETALKMRESQILEFRDAKYAEIQKARELFLKPIREKMIKAIQDVAKEEKLNLVLDKTSPSVLYSVDKFDITFRVIDKIKRGSK